MQQTIKCPYCSAEIIVTLDREAMNYSINKHLDVEPHKTQSLVHKQQIASELSIQYFQIIRENLKSVDAKKPTELFCDKSKEPPCHLKPSKELCQKCMLNGYVHKEET